MNWQLKIVAMHRRDRSLPLAESPEGMNQLSEIKSLNKYGAKNGKNYHPHPVEKIHQ